MWKFCFLPQTLDTEEFEGAPSAQPLQRQQQAGHPPGQAVPLPLHRAPHSLSCPWKFISLHSILQDPSKTSTFTHSFQKSEPLPWLLNPLFLGWYHLTSKPGWGAAACSGLSAMWWAQPWRQMNLLAGWNTEMENIDWMRLTLNRTWAFSTQPHLNFLIAGAIGYKHIFHPPETATRQLVRWEGRR